MKNKKKDKYASLAFLTGRLVYCARDWDDENGITKKRSYECSNLNTHKQ